MNDDRVGITVDAQRIAEAALARAVPMAESFEQDRPISSPSQMEAVTAAVEKRAPLFR